MAIISFRDVQLQLAGNAGTVNVLRDISFDVEKGETLGLVGPSGSGKSSLLMLLGGLERSTSGTVQVLGHNLSEMNEDALALFRRQYMGVLFQSFHLIPTMTALENVALPLELAGTPEPFEKAMLDLDAVGLSNRCDHYPAQLSGGEQQRVALARAVVPRPEILLADEPTGNLDSASGQKIMDLLFEQNERCDTTLILVTHAPELAARCKRIITLNDGQIVQIAQNGAAA